MVFKLEKSTPGLSEEWGSGWKGTNFIVEIEETASAPPVNSDYLSSREDISSTETLNATNMIAQGPKIIVRTEEVLIVGLVLMLWVGAIVLFFNRWGKIRMLEPYQPKFQQQHRASCPLSDIDSIAPHQRASVSRMSMGFVNNVKNMPCQFNAYNHNPTIYPKEIEDMDLDDMWLQQDGATCHAAIETIAVLREKFNYRFISLRGDIKWQPPCV